MPQAATTAAPTPWLPPIPGLHRRDPEHRYWLGEVEFPVSVTGVLSVHKSPYALGRIEATRATWEPRGNQTHRALELFLGLRRPGNDGAGAAELQELEAGDYRDWIKPLITDPRWDLVEVIASERPTCCLRRRVAGTFDFAYVDDTLPTPQRPPWASEGPPRVLADLKTLGEAGSTYSTAAQLGGYMALEATHGLWYDYGQTLWARPGRTAFSPLYSRSKCLLAWAGAWAAWRALHPGGRAGISL
jgi:hypothetical protein